MIPETIHYCWFGGNPKPKLAEKCIKSWKKHCPDYELIEWNEDNYDISSAPLYVQQAYAARKWAFVTDYVRLWAVYNYGGIYLDTDVEIVRPYDALLCNHAFFGFEDGVFVNSGLGFGAEKGSQVLAEMMEEYLSASFIMEDGSFDTTACPVRNTAVLLQHGLIQDNSLQTLSDGILILPAEYLSPVSLDTGKKSITENTLSVHWFSGSWLPEEVRKESRKMQKNSRRLERRGWRHGFVKSLIGEESFEKLKRIANRH